MLEFIQLKDKDYIDGSSFNYKFNERSSPGFLCLLVESPTPEEIQRLCKEFKIQEKVFKRFTQDLRSLRYSFDPLVFSFTDYSVETERVRMSHLLFVLKKKVLVLVVSEKLHYYKALFNEIIETIKNKKIRDINHVFYEFIHRDVKENYDVLEVMSDRIFELENKIVEGGHTDKDILKNIILLKRSLVDMGKRLWASAKIVYTIRKDLTSLKLTAEETALLDDIHDTLLHQVDMIETQKETVTDLLEIYTTTLSNKLAGISNELNIVMKKMAALTIIIMVPTLIAGIYGMNFRHMPEINWIMGYGFSIMLMLFFASLTYYMFHKRKWI